MSTDGEMPDPGEKECSTDSEKLRIAARRERVWELRLRGKAIAAIAREIGCGATTVHGDLVATLAATRERTADLCERERGLQRGRLDKALELVSAAIDAGDATAIDLLLKVEARRSKLLGLDAPEQHEVTAVVSEGETTPSAARALVAAVFGAGALPAAPAAPPEDVVTAGPVAATADPAASPSASEARREPGG